MKYIYLDFAASSPIRPEVLDIMIHTNQYYSNPSCLHEGGQQARDIVETARDAIAESINAEPEEIIFTSGATESNSLALLGFQYRKGRGHIVTTNTEHSSVLNTCKYMERIGHKVTYLPVDKNGLIDLDQLERSINRDTAIISIIFANNETGTIQDIERIGKIARKHGCIFHTDAVQAFDHIPIDVEKLNVDSMSASAHKIYGPKGVGFLYIRKGIDMRSIMFGGSQEYNLRPGTENVQGIAGLGKAAQLAQSDFTDYFPLKRKFVHGINDAIDGAQLNGSMDNSLSNIVNMSFDGCDGETLVTMLSSRGIYASNSAACLYSHTEPSHVLKAIGLSNRAANSSVRFSFGRNNQVDEIPYVIDALVECVERIRNEGI